MKPIQHGRTQMFIRTNFMCEEKSIFRRFPNPPFRNPVEWKKFYSKEVMESVLATIVPLSFQQSFVC